MSLEDFLGGIDEQLQRRRQWREQARDIRETRIRILKELWQRAIDNSVVIYLYRPESGSQTQIEFTPTELKVYYCRQGRPRSEWETIAQHTAISQLHDFAPSIPEGIFQEIIDPVGRGDEGIHITVEDPK